MADIVVTGYMVRLPTAGNAMAFAPYVLGLHRLGHRVTYLEESGWPGSCFDPTTGSYGDDPDEGLRRARALLRSQGCAAPVWWFDRAGGRTDGATQPDIVRALRDADLVLNLGGVNWLDELATGACHALVDMDPLFTQAGLFGGDLDTYDLLLTYGTAVGREGCRIPTGGRDWTAQLPPAVPEMWTVPDARAEWPPGGRMTTVANWSAYRCVELDGEVFGSKDSELLALAGLPRDSPVPLEIALSGAPREVVDALEDGGWRVVPGGRVTGDLGAYAGYLVGSLGELSPAKHGYVAGRTGWFSDRSVCYLSAGRPVVLQDTGFRAGGGDGLLLWSDAASAVDALEQVHDDPARHRRAARSLAQDVFGYRRTLPPLLELAGIAS